MLKLTDNFPILFFNAISHNETALTNIVLLGFFISCISFFDNSLVFPIAHNTI